jgi:hypothetical protein
MYVYRGNIHIHSFYSDGHASIGEITRAAASAGLSFIIITDHNTLKGLPEEGFRHGVLALVGSEINVGKNHYLALGIHSEIPPNDDDPQKVIDAAAAQGGFGFIAHPFEKGSRLVHNYRRFPWDDWNVTGFTGIEVWNWCSQWRDNVKTLLLGLYCAYLNPAGPITGPDPEAMAVFDRLSQTRPLTAIAGSDAHAWPIRRGPVRRTIFPYGYQFRTANNCLLLEQPLSTDFTTAKNQVYDALRRGRSFIINNLLGDAAGFTFTVQSNGTAYQIGDTAPLSADTALHITCPRGRLRVIQSGRLLAQVPRGEVRIPLRQPGAYRLEVYKNKKPWLFTNPIYVR